MDLMAPDPEIALDFYGGVFGWRFDDRRPGGAAHPYYVARLDDHDVAAIRSGEGSDGGWLMHVRVEDADQALARVGAAGGRVTGPPRDAFDGGRVARVADQAGAGFAVWQTGEHPGAELVNAPNSWNFNELNTGDPEGADRFYGSVFGWQVSRWGTEADSVGMWWLPGYADVLEQHDPGLRARHAEAGAPPHFSDAIAWLVPSGAVSSYWSVTFSVADTDAVADAAAGLGGTVVQPPRDVDYARLAVLRDPAGAAFTVSRYMPGQ
jgi:predicted enzyme related to lactoylglutathione lyase